ncbi:MAG: hypothetical protein ACOY9D_10955 [Pseudomonadota bacterium]
MLNPRRILAALLLLALPHAASASLLTDKFTPGTPYYFDNFDPGKKPWEPGQYLNIEEVFKNYQYFKIVFDQDGKGITVYRYLRGNNEGSEKYRLLPDNSLQKK